MALSLVSAVAAADEPSVEQRSEAMKRFHEGIAASNRGDFEAARLRFLQALTVFPERPSLLWNLGVAEMKTHHPAAAIGHFRDYLRLPAATNADRAKASAYLDEAARETGHVVVTVDPGAVVRLDDGAFEDAPAEPLDVEPGPHVLEARVGTQAKSASVSPQAGETVTVDLKLPPPPAPEATPAVPAATPPSPSARVAPESRPAQAGFAQASATMSVPDTPSSPTARIVVTVALGAVAAGAVVTGLVFLGNASSEGNLGAAAVASPLPGGCANPANAAPCSSGHQAAENEAQDKNVATGMFVGGGALAAGAVASWLLLAPKSQRESGVGIAPVVSPTGAGCVLSGRF
jgi:hypothetical protein